MTYRIGPIAIDLPVVVLCGAALLFAGCADKTTNNPPTISGDPPTQVQEDDPYSFVPTAKDSEGDTLTFSITNQPSWASFDSTTGKLSGTPANKDVGTTKGIVITVTDSADGKASLEPFDLEVSNVNDPPTAGEDAVSTNEGSPVIIRVLANDSDLDGDVLNISGVDTSSNEGGAVTDNNDGTLTYTPKAGFSGSDYFSYTVSDGNGGTDEGRVTITVNALPVATGSCHDTTQADTVSGTLQGSDVEGAVTFALGADGSKGSGPMPSAEGGSVTLTNAATGTYSYTPPAGNNKRGITDSFQFRVTDSQGATDSATETINIGLNVMPLGDSITSGVEDVIGSNSTPEAGSRKGYRQPLYNMLVNAGYAVDFVGSRNDGSGASPGYDHNAEGWPGATSAQIAGTVPGPDGFAGVGDALDANPADVILLHIGTNDMTTTDVGDIEDILNAIDTWEQANNHTVTVVLARIIDQWHRTESRVRSEVTALNNAIDNMVGGRSSDDIILVDMQSVLAYPDDLGDENHTYIYRLHPGTSGYAKMANTWFNALTNNDLVNKCP